MRSQIVILTILSLSSCCDYKDTEIHEIANGKGCRVYQVGCDHLFFTKCAKSKNIMTEECHMESQGKTSIQVCSQNETIND